ncbi:hypothetical protein AB685_19205 [Bacillus sp. LL01]|nr:hypothetical protein AB685_19205 [Bacillus sp. LL01]
MDSFWRIFRECVNDILKKTRKDTAKTADFRSKKSVRTTFPLVRTFIARLEGMFGQSQSRFGQLFHLFGHAKISFGHL